jgi:hypothetical protein
MVNLSQCSGCKHAQKAGHRPTGEIYLRCSAFPDGIPDEIAQNLVRHTKPYPGDHGIQYEPIEEEAEAKAVSSRDRRKVP